MTLTDTSQVPGIPGFEPHFRKSPVTDPWEPLYSRRTESAVHHGAAAGQAAHQCRGLIHGGLIAALPTTRWATASRRRWVGTRASRW